MTNGAAAAAAIIQAIKASGVVVRLGPAGQEPELQGVRFLHQVAGHRNRSGQEDLGARLTLVAIGQALPGRSR